MAENYDVFLSYASEDRAWAVELERTLRLAGLSIFRDSNEIRAGEKWEPQLEGALASSKHLVVLWSDKAKDSDWVQKELYRFDAMISKEPGRRIFCVNLNRENAALASLQAIKDLQLAGAYPGEPPSQSPAWQSANARIVEAVRTADGAVPIAVALLTFTAPGFAALDKEGRAKIADLGADPAGLAARYGQRRADWRPYGGDHTVETMLSTLLGDVNQVTAKSGARFRLQYVDDRLWNEETRKPAAAEMCSAPLTLVVVDTFVLVSSEGYKVAQVLYSKLQRDTSIWIFVPPESDKRIRTYRDKIQKWSEPLLDPYFDPPMESAGPALLGVDCSDTQEIQRLLKLGIGRYSGRKRSLPRDSFTEVIAGR